MTLSNLFFGKTIISVGVTQGDFSILSAFAGHTGPARGGMPKTWLDRSVVMSRPTVAADNTGVPVGAHRGTWVSDSLFYILQRNLCFVTFPMQSTITTGQKNPGNVEFSKQATADGC